MRRRLAAALALCVVGCSEGNPNICSRPPAVWDGLTRQAVTEGCLHRWAYRLARAPGPNPEIAEAALSACEDSVLMLAGQRAEQYRVPADQLAENTEAAKQEMRRLALFHVVQARAGDCPIP